MDEAVSTMSDELRIELYAQLAVEQGVGVWTAKTDAERAVDALALAESGFAGIQAALVTFDQDQAQRLADLQQRESDFQALIAELS